VRCTSTRRRRQTTELEQVLAMGMQQGVRAAVEQTAVLAEG
jgi:hypothetical protein